MTMRATSSRSRPGLPPKPDGRERFGMFPVGRRPLAYLYALGFANGETKIGLATRPRSRVVTHWVNSHGGVVWAHLFSPTDRRVAVGWEQRALLLAAREGRRVRKTEVFAGLPRESALRCVRQAKAA